MAANLIKLGPNCSAGMDQQTYKQIHRIGQDRECIIWYLREKDSPDELAVAARQEKKANFIAAAYGLKQDE